MKIYKEPNNSDSEVFFKNINFNSDIHESIYDSLAIINILDHTDEEKNDPFYKIRTELVVLCEENGFYSMKDFFKLYINDKYTYFLDGENLELFELYNKIFVPINIEFNDYISKKDSDSNHNFIIKKIHSECDALMNNTLSITIAIKNLACKIVFNGYVSVDTLNTYIRTSQIYSKHIFFIKTESRNIIKKKYPQIDDSFLTKYNKFMNCGYYFVNDVNELVDKIVSDYHMFTDLVAKNFNLIMKDFIHSNIKTMFNIINLF